jgi:hypothetical protein
MWMLSFIPDSWLVLAVHIIFGLGVLGLALTWVFGNILDHFTFISPYVKLIRSLSIVLFVSGLYFEGGIGAETEWREKVAALEEKVKIAETQSKEANIKLRAKVLEKIKIIQKNVVNNKQEINTHKVIIDSECKLNDKAIDIYNSSIKNGTK